MKDNQENLEILDDSLSSALELTDVRKHRIAAMILAGFDDNKIAEMTEISIYQIKALQKEKSFHKLLMLSSAKIYDSAMAKLCLNSEKAVDTIINILDNQNISERLKLQAAIKLLELAGKSKTAILEERLERLENLIMSGIKTIEQDN